jgi:hypothetical protein
MSRIYVFAVVLVLGVLGGCEKPPHPHTAQSLPVNVFITYPPPEASDPLDLRNCPLSASYHAVNCRLVGTTGPVKRILWPDNHLKVTDASIDFDRHGNISKVCRRGRTDFQGWGCASAPFQFAEPEPRTTLDDRGRILRRQHNSFHPERFDTCVYDDRINSKMSECRDGEFVITYTFDNTGRALTFKQRRIPASGESEERTRYLDGEYAVNLKYSYKNDRFGNWIEFSVTEADNVYFTQTREIEYYD